MTKKQVEESLIEQLRLQNKVSNFYMDLVNDYMYYWALKKKLQSDINKKGLRYTAVNGNGVEVEKVNENVVNLQKTTSIMLKLLSDLQLKEPIAPPGDPADDYC